MRRVLLVMLVGVACLLALVWACYGRALFRGEQFAFRDAAHFYYPLYLRVQQEWDAHRWPLWEPEENGGMPLLGNPTAAVLYPGKVIYGLCSYPWAARLYIVAHTVLAFLGMVALLRSWAVSRVGSTVAGLSYAFAAPVMFQYCNVIFLVGAAWLPWGLRAADRWLRQGRRGALLELAVVLAMQTLGGDPQAAYLTGLCAGGYALGLAWRSRAEGRPPSGARLLGTGLGAAVLLIVWVGATLLAARLLYQGGPGKSASPGLWTSWSRQAVLAVWVILGLAMAVRWRRQGPFGLGWKLAGLLGAAVLGLGLSAAQLLPVMEFTSLSIRAADEGPHDIYPFSLEPHRALEFVWPNLYGTTFGANRYWLAAVPPKHAPSTWVPSLYLGAAALVLAIGAAGLRGGPPWRVWLTAIAILSFLAALGEYGSPLWWARRTVPAASALFGPPDTPESGPMRADSAPHDGDGSPYWFMATFLPGFRAFRYPSKLLTLTCLALSALAGLGWDRVVAGRGRRTLVTTAVLAAVSLSGLACVSGAKDRLVTALARSDVGRGGSIYGPLEPEKALADTQRALAHGTVVLLATLCLVVLARRRPELAGLLVLVVVTADLARANASLVMTLPQSVLQTPPTLLSAIQEAEKDDPADGPFRVHRMPLWNPPGWYKQGDPSRPREIVEWERDTLQPKYGLPFGLQYTLVEGTTELYDYWWFFGAFYRTLDPKIRLPGATPGQKVVYYPRRGFDMWNTRYFLLPVYPHAWKDEQRGYASFLPETDLVAPKHVNPFTQRWIDGQDWQLLRNRAAYPRAWVVHDARRLQPIVGMDRRGRRAPMEEILYQNDALWSDASRVVHDPRRVAWIETDDLSPLAEFLPRTPTDPAETVRITRYTPQRVELTATLKQPGLVVLADVFYPGWHLTIDGQPERIWRANRMMRGAVVKAGTHHLIYTYDPPLFRVGGGVTLASLAVLLILLAWVRRHPVQPGANPLARDASNGVGAPRSPAATPRSD